MVAITTHEVADIAIYRLLESRILLVPELPTGHIVDDKESQLVTRIHKCRVLWAVCIADNSQTEVTQLLCITPMSGVRHSVTHYGKVLMTIDTDKRLFVVLAIEVETISPLELDGANTDTTAITIHYLATLVENADIEVVEGRGVG